MRLFADAEFVVAAFERQGTARDPDQARDLAKQRGLAGAVSSGNEQGLAGRNRKIQIPENRPSAALASQGICGKRQGFSHLSTPRRKAM
jgi:hypothetical protein